MKGKVRIVLSIAVLCGILISGCGSLTAKTAGDAASAEESQAGLANPAAVYCEEQGGEYEIRTAADGSQDGACVFEDGSECEGWAFYRGECSPETGAPSESAPEAVEPAEENEDGDGQNPVGMANPASVHCEEQGGVLEIKSDEAGNQFGVCVLEDGTECDEWAYFLGECGPGTVSAEAAEDLVSVFGWYGLVTAEEGAAARLALLPEGAGTVDLVVDSTPAGGDVATALATASDGAIPVHVWGSLSCDATTCVVNATRVVLDGSSEAIAPDSVDGWQGALQELAPGAQFDDVFVLYDPNLILQYGIDAPDPAVAAELADLRGTGRTFFVFGELTCNVIDVNGCQIRADRLEFRE